MHAFSCCFGVGMLEARAERLRDLLAPRAFFRQREHSDERFQATRCSASAPSVPTPGSAAAMLRSAPRAARSAPAQMQSQRDVAQGSRSRAR